MKETAKEAILARIRRAIVNAPEPPPIPRDFRERDERDHAAILEDFIDRLLDYKAMVTRTDEAGVSQAIANACQQHNIIRLVVPADIPTDWVPGRGDGAAGRSTAGQHRSGRKFRRAHRLRRRHRPNRNHHP